VADLCELFTPTGKMVYAGDSDDKFAYYDEALLKSLGVTIEGGWRRQPIIPLHASGQSTKVRQGAACFGL